MTARRIRSTSTSVGAPKPGSKMSAAATKAVDISSKVEMMARAHRRQVRRTASQGRPIKHRSNIRRIRAGGQ